MYEAGATLAEIGAAYGVTRQRAKQFCGTYGLTYRKIVSTCKRCGRLVSARVRRSYCSKKCYRLGTRYDKCECGRAKAKQAARCRICYRPDRLTIDLAGRYYRLGMTCEEVGRAMKCSTMGAWKLVKRSGVKMRRPGQKPNKTAA